MITGITDKLQSRLGIRAAVIRSIRRFFDALGYLEVETPVLLTTPALELHIDAIPAGRGHLRTSPELHMKRLLAGGCSKIYQIGACFRHGEQGRFHSPEFTMLEWYRTNTDYLGILDEAHALLTAVCRDVHGGASLAYRGQRIAVAGAWEHLTVAEAFVRSAGWDPIASYDPDRFDLDLIEKVEPAFPADRPTVLLDYPAQAAALARCRPGRVPVAERWELYIGGLELANAFTELTDAAEQRRRFEACAAERRARNRDVYALDEEFLAALERGMPSAGGIALGIDRLAMLMCDAASIEEVRPFSSASATGD
jgi:lysyl-tRNA synthetase class 2